MTLADLMATLERRATEAEHVGATAPVANVYRDVVAELQAVNGTAAPSVAPATVPDRPALERHLTAKQVEEILQVPKGYAYDHKLQLGAVKIGKYVRFPESAVRRRLERSR